MKDDRPIPETLTKYGAQLKDVVSHVWYDTLRFPGGVIDTAPLSLFCKAVGLCWQEDGESQIATWEITNLHTPNRWAARGQVFAAKYFTVSTNLPRLWLSSIQVELRVDGNRSYEEMPLDLALNKGPRLFEESYGNARMIEDRIVNVFLRPQRLIACPQPLYLRFEVNGALFRPVEEIAV